MRGGCHSPAVAVRSSGCCALLRASCTVSQQSSRTSAKDGRQQAGNWDGFPIPFFFSPLHWINTSKILELKFQYYQSTKKVRLGVFSFCLCRCISCEFVSHRSSMSEGDLLESSSNRVCLFLVLLPSPCMLIFSTSLLCEDTRFLCSMKMQTKFFLSVWSI